MTEDRRPTYFISEAAAYCSQQLNTFRVAHYQRGYAPADGKVAGHPFWYRETLDRYKYLLAAHAIFRNGVTYYPSVTVAKMLRMSRATFSLWYKRPGHEVRADIIVNTRPYFRIETVEGLRALRALRPLRQRDYGVDRYTMATRRGKR